MNYYMIHETEWHFDGHSDVEEGATVKFISTDDKYSVCKDHYEYDMDLNETTDTTDQYVQAVDGYHAIRKYFTIYRLTEEEAKEYTKILDAYNEI